MSRRGVALPLVLVVLLIASSMAGLLLRAASLHLRTGTLQLSARLALEAASGSADWQAEHWDSAAAAGLLPGQRAALGSPLSRPRLGVSDSMTRLDDRSFLVSSMAEWRDLDGRLLTRRGVVRLLEASPGGHSAPIPGGWWGRR